MRTFIILMICVQGAIAAPVIELGSDTLRFGHISAGGNHTRQLQVNNTGNTPLIISRIELGNPVFTLLSPALPDTIRPNLPHPYIFRFHPISVNSYNESFVFQSNDPITPQADLIVEATGVPLFAAGEIIWSYQGIENVVSCAAKDDIDGDGIQEVVAESYDAGAEGNHLICVSGSGYGNGHLIWSSRPSLTGGYGDQCLITISDLNQNGTQDIILGTAWSARTVFAIEGSNGQTIWAFNTNIVTPSAWIYSVASLGDINGDGIPEVLAGVGSDANKGYCLYGSNGTRRWRWFASDVIYSACRIDDVSGDGVPDAIFGEGDVGDAVYCVSGNSPDSAHDVWTYHTGGSVQSVARIADINHDGFNDVIAGYWNGGDKVIALSGHGDSVTTRLWSATIDDPVMKVVVCPDLNHDGHEDVLVASWGDYAIALSGANGSQIWQHYMGNDVWAIAWSPDVTNDGIPEAIAGSFNGDVALLDGANGNALWTTHTDAKIFTVRSIGDVNGDGFPDVIAGQQMLNGVGGKFFVLSGGTLVSSGVEDQKPILPENQLIVSNYPNPFNAETMISYELPQPSEVTLEIYNINGQRVRNLVHQFQNAGRYSVLWDGRDIFGKSVATGIYFSRITAGDLKTVNKMTALK
jgi:hypothetical protein